MTTNGWHRYFAYGSNMSIAQMAERCPGAANPVRAVLTDHAWLCNERGVATIAPVAGRLVHGVVWDVSVEHIERLDHHEGVASGRYRRATLEVTDLDGNVLEAIVYIDDGVAPGRPRPGYLERVLTGAGEHSLPDDYLDYLRRWADAPRDPVRKTLTSDGPQTLAELLARPGVVETVELRSSFGFMAIHAGQLEEATDRIAADAAALAGASYYGVSHPADLDHHLPSTRYRPEDSVALAAFIEHVGVVVSIHGYGRREMWTSILAGGGNRRLAAHIKDHLEPALDGYTVVTDLDEIPRELRGLHRYNPVNAPVHGGVQLELPPRVRGLSPLSPPTDDDGLSPPTRALIQGLADAVSTWSGQ